MRGYIANTDQRWFEFLRGQPRHADEEVNFWFPSAYRIFRGRVGSPWLFRLKAPVNKIGGFGIVERAERLPEYLAWECFGRGNGTETLQELEERIADLRERSDIQRRSDRDQIACTILSQPVFFPPELWIPQPTDWKKANLRYEGYDLTQGEGLRVWAACLAHAKMISAPVIETVEVAIAAERYGKPIEIRPRLGQGGFRLAVTDAYGRACAVTREHSLPVLEAAHIRPYGMGGSHEIQNGLLLRSDVHRLFDRGYVTVTPERRFRVSRHLRDDFSNGRSYYPLDGAEIALPATQVDWPSPELLSWHNEHKFRA